MKVPTKTLLFASEKGESQEVFYESIALTGFVSKFSNFAEPYAFTKLHEKNKWKHIAAVSDDIPFAKKRLTTPKNVYRYSVTIFNSELLFVLIRI